MDSHSDVLHHTKLWMFTISYYTLIILIQQVHREENERVVRASN